jgi:hypothetical protein
MRRRINLTESDLRNLISESVKRILKENDEYDWDEFEADPEGTKDLENDISWNIKDIGDRKGMADTMPEELMWDEKNDMYPSHDDMGFFKDDLEQYDNGYDSIYGDRDVSDEYYGDSDYRFTHDEWNEDDPLMNLDRAFEPTSDLNRRYNESKIRRIVRESMREFLTEGEQWIGDYNQDNFGRLVEKATACGGRCSFNLAGKDFTMTPINSGANCIRITSGTDVVCESYSIYTALVHAWSWAHSF